ncbi:MAG: DUF4249 family protein, partial [Bacteroidetes bacterium]|nr:DUF4249 family protein [Bacteroidota bacterium]
MIEVKPQWPVHRNGKGARRISFLLMLLVLLGLVSCETLVNTIPESKLPKTESQLTLFSFISPQDSVIRVRVGQTRPIFSESPVVTFPVMVVTDGDTIYVHAENIT